MDLREFLQKTIKTTINGMISEGKPIPMDTPNDFVYSDFKKYAYKNRTMFKKELQKSKFHQKIFEKKNRKTSIIL